MREKEENSILTGLIIFNGAIMLFTVINMYLYQFGFASAPNPRSENIYCDAVIFMFDKSRSLSVNYFILLFVLLVVNFSLLRKIKYVLICFGILLFEFFILHVCLIHNMVRYVELVAPN